MRLALVIVAVFFAVASAADYATMFSDFKAKYGRVYATKAETEFRFKTFVENMKRAEEMQAMNPLATFGVNAYADVSAAEFKVRHNAEASFAKYMTKRGPEPIKGLGMPEPIDWRTRGAVTPIKNQWLCGGCWSFSTTGNIEGQWFLAGNPLVSLSEQELLSCDTNDLGCGGGTMDTAMEWLVQARGGVIQSEASYPFVSANNITPACHMHGTYPAAVIVGHQDFAQDEATIGAMLNTNGPISIAVDSSSFHTYTGGIMTNCISQQLDHAVLIVGFNTTGPTPYWIVKNQWGTSWGIDGYIYLQYGTNQCLMKSAASSSIVKKGATLPPTVGPVPSFTPVPPFAVFTQSVCSNDKCTKGCESNTLPQNTCIPAQGGGSAIAKCTATSLIISSFGSSDCTGPSQQETQSINVCEQAEGGGYFENVCTGGSAALHTAAKAKKLMRKL